MLLGHCRGLQGRLRLCCRLIVLFAIRRGRKSFYNPQKMSSTCLVGVDFDDLKSINTPVTVETRESRVPRCDCHKSTGQGELQNLNIPTGNMACENGPVKCTVIPGMANLQERANRAPRSHSCTSANMLDTLKTASIIPNPLRERLANMWQFGVLSADYHERTWVDYDSRNCLVQNHCPEFNL
jgi:hypothetical protein